MIAGAGQPGESPARPGETLARPEEVAVVRKDMFWIHKIDLDSSKWFVWK